MNVKAYDYSSKEKCTQVVNSDLESENIFMSTFSMQLKLLLSFPYSSTLGFHGSKVFNLEKKTREEHIIKTLLFRTSAHQKLFILE